MEDTSKFVKQWFSQRSARWLPGHGTMMDEEALLRQTMNRRRAAIDRKVITDVQITGSRNLDDEQSMMEIDVIEYIRFLYEIGGSIEHEERFIPHVLTWKRGEAEPIDHQQLNEAVHEGTELINFDNDAVFTNRDYRFLYDRVLAIKYAERWWNERNREYINMGVDCTNYVSQVLHAGGFPFTGGMPKRAAGWWYQFGSKPDWSFSWSVAHALALLMINHPETFHAQIVDRPENLNIGDMISYDWKGTGRYTHSTIVTGMDANGYPLVNAHTVDSHKRFFSYEDSYAFTPSTQYLFTHFAD